MEIIHVGERIRDIKIKDNKIYMILENSPSLYICLEINLSLNL